MFKVPEKNNYTITHIHTMLSNGVTNIDSVTDYHEYIDKAVELGMKAIAFTEHGNVFSWYFKKCYCEKKGLKYIHAIETYVTKDLNEKIRDNYHCCLYALNYDGVKELNKLSSKAFEDDHKYYTPRISFKELLNMSNNIAISTACLGGILNSGDEELEEEFIKFLVKNKHRCFLEIQHHNTKSQYEYNKKLYDLHKQYGIPLIASTDTHALNQEHVEGRSILQKAKDIYFDDEDGWDLTMKSYDELVEAFTYHDFISKEDVFDAINNTNVLAEMVEEFTVNTSYKYPKMYEDSLEVFKTKIKEGVIRREIHKLPNYEEYTQRIREELKSYVHNGAIDFMLLMEDIVQWCIKKDIKLGYGRGSVNGSIIAYVLGITEMDSIKYNLNFERFMNVERVSLAD